MSLREETWRYEKLTDESAEHTPIIKIGAYLDGVDKGIEILEKLKTEIKEYWEWCDEEVQAPSLKGVRTIIDNHIEELKGKNQ